MDTLRSEGETLTVTRAPPRQRGLSPSGAVVFVSSSLVCAQGRHQRTCHHMCVTTYKDTHGVRTTLYAQVGDFPTPRGRISAAVRLGYLSRLHPYEGRT